jgi:hypothetical protein
MKQTTQLLQFPPPPPPELWYPPALSSDDGEPICGVDEDATAVFPDILLRVSLIAVTNECFLVVETTVALVLTESCLFCTVTTGVWIAFCSLVVDALTVLLDFGKAEAVFLAGASGLVGRSKKKPLVYFLLPKFDATLLFELHDTSNAEIATGTKNLITDFVFI